jgi:hypothetical protein
MGNKMNKMAVTQSANKLHVILDQITCSSKFSRTTEAAKYIGEEQQRG